MSNPNSHSSSVPAEDRNPLAIPSQRDGEEADAAATNSVDRQDPTYTEADWTESIGPAGLVALGKVAAYGLDQPPDDKAA